MVLYYNKRQPVRLKRNFLIAMYSLGKEISIRESIFVCVCIGGAGSITVIGAVSEIGVPCSISGLFCFVHFALTSLEKGTDLSSLICRS